MSTATRAARAGSRCAGRRTAAPPTLGDLDRARGRRNARGVDHGEPGSHPRPDRALDAHDDVVSHCGICDGWQGDDGYRRATHSTGTGAVLWPAELVL